MMNQETDFFGYVSSLAVEGDSIVLWVQTNNAEVRKLESVLPSHCTSGWTLPTRVPADVIPGSKCFTSNAGKYVRVLVHDVIRGEVLAQAIDYGFEFWTDYQNLLLPVATDPYIGGPSLADKIYVAGLTLKRPPTNSELVALGETVCYKNWTVRIEERSFRRVSASFYNAATDLKSLFVTMGLVREVERIQPNMRVHAPTLQFPLPEPQRALPVEEPRTLHFINPQPVQMGATVEVVVTDASEGPWGFTIQKKEDMGLLADVADAMQKVDKIMLKSTLFLTQTCLAYCPSLQIYARGLIVGMTENKVSVLFVDYGCSAVLGSKDLFKLPNSGLFTPILGHRFTLNGINDIKIKDGDKNKMIELFRDIVKNVRLVLRAVPAEDGGFQTCELYLKNTNENVKKILNTRMQQLKLKYSLPKWPAVGSVVPAFICHMESSELFFVQLTEGVDELQEIIQDVAMSSLPIQKERLKVNMPCLALFSDEQWYRAVIRKIVGTNLEVFFVDYGNSHVVTLNDVKEIPLKVVSGYKNFAIPCSLDGQEQYDSQELKSKLEAVVNEDNFQIEVTAVRDDLIVVKILRNGVDYFKVQKSQNGYGRDNNQADHFAENRFTRNTEQQSNWRAEKTDSADGFNRDRNERSNWRSDNVESANGFSEDGGRKRFDNRDNQRSHQREAPSGFNGDSGRKRFDDNRDSQGSYPREDRREATNGFNGDRKRFDDNRDGQRSYQRESTNGFNEDGGRKRFDNNRDGERSYPKRENTGGPAFKNRDQGTGDNANKFGDDDRPRRQPIRNEDRITPGDNFPEQIIDDGKTEDVLVTSFVSPHEFYVQTQANHADFMEMMTRLQTDYDMKYSFKKTDPPQVGDPVIAEFSGDRCLYRAHVIESEPMAVRFADYGNFEDVRDSRNVYPVMKKYAEMPVQAVKCSLKGVKCIGDDWSSEISQHFDKESFSCVFHENNDGTYVVSLSYEGNDLATELIAQNLVASDSDLPQVATTSLEETTTEFEDIDKTLLPGQILVCTVPFICGFTSFFIHVKPDLVTRMETLIAEYVAKEDLKQVSNDDLQPDTMCLIPLEGVEGKYRGKILKICENDQISVQYVDYGDTCEFSSAEIFCIPEELAAIPALAIECCIFGNTTDLTNEIQDQFKNDCEGIDFIIDVKGLEEDKLSVVIYYLTGQKVPIQNGINDAPVEVSIPTLPLLTREVTAEIADFVAPSSVLIRLPHITSPEIGQFYTEVDTSEEVEIDALCAVKASDDLWYRAKRLTENQAYLLDNGRTEEFSLITKLTPEARSSPLAVCEVNVTWLFTGKCRVTVQRSEDGFTIEPVKKLATISFIESANDVFVSPPCVAGELIDTALADTVPGERPSEKIFAARYPADEQWYRAEVIDEDTMTVKFIDYGNTSEVTEVAPLPPKLKLIAPQAVAVHFEGTLPETALATLEDLQIEETPLTLIKTDQGTFELHLNGFNLLTKLTGLLPLAVDDLVYVSHAVGPELIFLQRDKDNSYLTEITEVLQTAELKPLSADPEPNQLVAAQYLADGAWYRARVEGDKVVFVDHGNDEAISELRELPENLKNIPPLAVRAALLLTDGYKWTDDAAEAVYELFAVELKVQEVSVINGTYVVRLFADDSDLGKKIVVEGGNVSEATTEPVTEDAPQDIGRDLVEEIVEDVVLSFVEDMSIDTSGSNDSGTFSKDLNSPPGKEDNGKIRQDDQEKIVTIDVENGNLLDDEEVAALALQTEKFHFEPDDIVQDISQDIQDEEIPDVALDAAKLHFDPDGTEDAVAEDVDAIEDVTGRDLDINEQEITEEEEKLHVDPLGTEDAIAEDVTGRDFDIGEHVAVKEEAEFHFEEDTIVEVECISEQSDTKEEATLDSDPIGTEDVKVEDLTETIVEVDCSDLDCSVHAAVSDDIHTTEKLRLDPGDEEITLAEKVKAELIDLTDSDDGELVAVTGKATVNHEEVSNKKAEDNNNSNEAVESAEVPLPQLKEQLPKKKVSSDEKIVPGSINRGVLFSDS